MTDIAFRTLTDPDLRHEYDATLLGKAALGSQPKIETSQDKHEGDSEKCICGAILKADDEGLCHECCGRLDYSVVFDVSGGYIVRDSEVFGETESPSQVSFNGVVFGPFTREEAEAFLQKKNRMRSKADGLAGDLGYL